MKLLFENWRDFKNEAQDPDSNSDDSAELKNMAPEINREFIEKIIGDFSFNSGQSSQHRWSPRQPIIDYYFDERIGSWKYTATIPDGTNNADKWPTINSSPDENIEEFLTRVEDSPQQLNLFENWRNFKKKVLNEMIDDQTLNSRKRIGSLRNIKDSSLKDALYNNIMKYATKKACLHWAEAECKVPNKHEMHFDAHKHILASALFARKYNVDIARFFGKAREYTSNSGRDMDIANNELGFSYGIEQNNKFSDDQIDRLVHDRIKKGFFYIKDGKTFFKDM